MSTNKLKNLDMFTAGNKKQYKQIAVKAQVNDLDLFVENCLIRGGCFYSERKKQPIAGVLQNGNSIEFKEFISGIN